MKKLAIILFVLSNLTYGQNCDCKKNLEFLINKVEKDYPGFADKVTKNTKDDYTAFTKVTLDKATQTNTFHRCFLILEEWLTFFKDKHLQMAYEINRFWTYKKISDSTVMLRIPSFRYDEKYIVDSLISTHFNEITSTPNLIIDLRGNSGGIDYSYLKLLPLVYSQPYYSDAAEWYASDGNIRSFENALATGKIRKGGEEWTKTLVKLMKDHRGSFVVIDPPDTVKKDTVYKYPRKVGLIIDDFCGSSCEQFILEAKHSIKVKVFGCRTFGVLDYSNTSPENFPMEGLSVYVPKTRSTRLPKNPIDNIGIAPDIEINLPYNLDVRDKADDWVIFVKDYLESNK